MKPTTQKLADYLYRTVVPCPVCGEPLIGDRRDTDRPKFCLTHHLDKST